MKSFKLINPKFWLFGGPYVDVVHLNPKLYEICQSWYFIEQDTAIEIRNNKEAKYLVLLENK